MKKVLIPVFLFLFVWSCSTTESITERDPGDSNGTSPYLEIPDEVVDEFVFEDLDDLEMLMFQTRSSLSDQYVNLQHDMPEVFTREIVRDEREVDEYAGFRVQILSTRDVVHADTTKDHFVAWADKMIEGYQPEAYVYFRQPYYRVRAGDFRDREMAIEFSRMIKQFFPDAWVIHDRIEPQRVPADTTDIKFRELSDTLVPIDSRFRDQE
jgi:hypothetical protein